VSRRASRKADGGFTLIEVLVVVAVLGLLSTVLAATFVVVIRTNPANEQRVDDARILKGISTWLPPDIDSTPSAGFDTNPSKVSDCAGSHPGTNALHLTWTEMIGSTVTTYVANYRHVVNADGDSAHIERITCRGTGPPPLGSTSSAAVSEVISPDPADTVVTVDVVDTRVVRVEFLVHSKSGKPLRIEAAPKNPGAYLPSVSTTTPVPPSTTIPNLPPIVPATPFTLFENVHLTPISFPLPGIVDPEGDPLWFEFTEDHGWDVTGWSFDSGAGVYVVEITSPPLGSGGNDPFVHGTFDLPFTVADSANPAVGGVLRVTMPTHTELPPTGTTTTLPPTTTTTPPTTTLPPTTTTVPCVISEGSPRIAESMGTVNDAHVGISENGNTGTAPLLASVTVNIAWSGGCGSIQLRYDPSTPGAPGATSKLVNFTKSASTATVVLTGGAQSSDEWSGSQSGIAHGLEVVENAQVRLVMNSLIVHVGNKVPGA
jgi:prepilin-type N-terminal cleavage/methylation domain-containing protein